MDSLRIVSAPTKSNCSIQLPHSKSQSNRALIIQALSGGQVHGLSESTDTQVLKKTLSENQVTYYGGSAGTACRFLIALACFQNKNKVVDGSPQMKTRPIEGLINALNKLGFKIEYIENHGRLPVKITPIDFSNLKNSVQLDPSTSSQFVSALMLIAPMLPNGLIIQLTKTLTSAPYVNLTKEVMEQSGAQVSFNANEISIKPKPYKNVDISIEPDWSAASYWFEMAAFSLESEIRLIGLNLNSTQGDRAATQFFKKFGVETHSENNDTVLRKKTGKPRDLQLKLDLKNTPDLAQTLWATCAGLHVSSQFSGLKTLVNKETDRVFAMKSELKKIGYVLSERGVGVVCGNYHQIDVSSASFQTYDDHRMAMSLAPLSMLNTGISIENPIVVQKSYPHYWRDLETAGFIFES